MGIFIGRELGRERDGRDSLNVKVRYGYIYREGARKREREREMDATHST